MAKKKVAFCNWETRVSALEILLLFVKCLVRSISPQGGGVSSLTVWNPRCLRAFCFKAAFCILVSRATALSRCGSLLSNQSGLWSREGAGSGLYCASSARRGRSRPSCASTCFCVRCGHDTTVVSDATRAGPTQSSPQSCLFFLFFFFKLTPQVN